MGSKTAQLLEICDRLLAAYGPQHWWPGETPFEVMVGAILTQNTNWTNVEKAIANLRSAGVLEPRRMRKLPPARLAALIRPAGYFNVKERRLRAFLDWFETRHDCDLAAVRALGLGTAREELLAVKGIGPETADSILLYALEQPTFVIDAYTYRILRRHHLVGEETTYDEMKSLFEDNLPRDLRLYNEFHALLVHAGKESCRPTARCAGCPLDPLPHTV